MKLCIGAALVATALAFARAEEPSAGDPLPLLSSSPGSITALLNGTVASTVGAVSTVLKTAGISSSGGSHASAISVEPTPVPSASKNGSSSAPHPSEEVSLSPSPPSSSAPHPSEDASIGPSPISPSTDSPSPGDDHTAIPIVIPLPPAPVPSTPSPDVSPSPSPMLTTPAPQPSTTQITPNFGVTREPTPTPVSTPDVDVSPPPPEATMAPVASPTPTPTVIDFSASSDDETAKPTSKPTPKPTPTPTPTSEELESPPPPQATMAPVAPPTQVADSSASADEDTATPAPTVPTDMEDEDDYEISPTPPPQFLQPRTPRVDSSQEDRQNSTDTPAVTFTPTPVTPSTSETSVMSPSTPLSVDDTTIPPPQRYQRGDEIMTIKQQLSDGTTVNVQVVVSPAHAPMTLVRNANTLSTSGNQNFETGSLVSILRYVMPTMAFLSLWMLVLLHFASFVPSRALVSKYLRLNQWELLVFITYIQAFASTAQYIVRAAPQSLWDFVDGFSWTVFIPFHKSGGAVASTITSTRRLSEYVVLDGIIAFADRVGINETELLQTSVGGFLIVSGILTGMCLITLLFLRLRRKNDVDNSTDTRAIDAWMHLQRSQPSLHQRPMLLVYGLAVFVGTFAVYPLTLMVTFEITSESRAGQYSTNALTIALFVILLICLPLILRSIMVIYSIDTAEDFKRRKHTRVVWGILCSSKYVKYEARTFVVALWFVSQVLSAIVVGAVLSEVWQPLLLLIINIAVLGSIIVFRPFTDGLNSLPGVATCLISIVRILNCALSFGFISTTSAPRNALGNAFIFVNAVLIALWFARHCVMIVVVIRAFCSKSREQQPAGLSPLGSAATDAAYASALYVMVPPTQDGHHGGSAML